jgi:hypothetical protein
MKTKWILMAALAMASPAFGQDTMQPEQSGQSWEEPEQQGRSPSSMPGTTAESPASLMPKDVCMKLAQSFTADASGKQAEQWIVSDSKEKMKEGKSHLKSPLSGAHCASETIAGSHAVVVTKSGHQERLIPFVKQGGIWKFDPQSYNSLYRMDIRTPAGK